MIPQLYYFKAIDELTRCNPMVVSALSISWLLASHHQPPPAVRPRRRFASVLAPRLFKVACPAEGLQTINIPGVLPGSRCNGAT